MEEQNMAPPAAIAKALRQIDKKDGMLLGIVATCEGHCFRVIAQVPVTGHYEEQKFVVWNFNSQTGGFDHGDYFIARHADEVPAVRERAFKKFAEYAIEKNKVRD